MASPFTYRIEEEFLHIEHVADPPHSETAFVMWEEHEGGSGGQPEDYDGAIYPVNIITRAGWQFIEEYDGETHDYYRRNVSDVLSDIDAPVVVPVRARWWTGMDLVEIMAQERERHQRAVEKHLQYLIANEARKQRAAERRAREAADRETARQQFLQELGSPESVAERMFRERFPNAA